MAREEREREREIAREFRVQLPPRAAKERRRGCVVAEIGILAAPTEGFYSLSLSFPRGYVSYFIRVTECFQAKMDIGEFWQSRTMIKLT